MRLARADLSWCLVLFASSRSRLDSPLLGLPPLTTWRCFRPVSVNLVQAHLFGTPALTCHGRSQGLVQDNADVRPEAAVPSVRSMPIFFRSCGARFEACDLWPKAGRRPVSRACVVYWLLLFHDFFVCVRCGCSNCLDAHPPFFCLLCRIGPYCLVACCVHVLFPSPLSTGLTCRPKLRSPLSSRLQLNSSRYLPPRRPSLRGMEVASTQDSRQVCDFAGCPLCSLFWAGVYFARIALALASFPRTGGRAWPRGPVCRPHANRRPPHCLWLWFPGATSRGRAHPYRHCGLGGYWPQATFF